MLSLRHPSSAIIFVLFVVFLSSVSCATVLSGGISNEALRAYNMNDNTGTLSAQAGNAGLNVGNSPDFLAWNSAASILYVANENVARVASYKINSLSPVSLSFISEQNDQQNPAHIALHPSEKWLMTANYNQGSAVLWSVNAVTGAIAPRTSLINPGQKAHQIVYSKDGKFVYIPCLGSNYVAQYSFDANNGNMAAINPATVTVNGGPRHMVIHPTAPHAFVLTELSNQLYHFDYNSVTGVLSNGRPISSLPAGVNTAQSGAEISFGLNYRFIYASHRSSANGGLNAIALFSLSNTFDPTLVTTENGGGDVNFPRHFSIDPTEKFLLVGNQNGNTITSFSIDQTTGRLTKVNTIAGPGQPGFVSVIAPSANSPTNAPATTSAPTAGTGGGIITPNGARWDGSFNQWVNNNNAFCNCLFGGQCTYICAGGGDAGGGGNCNPVACTSGQYSFSSTDGWTIKTNKGGNPQRAFAYARICGDNQLNQCMQPGEVITFSFRFDNVNTWGGYIKIFFFGDGQNVLGLWPNRGMKLVAWPVGDLPEQWKAELPLQQGLWYDVTLTIVNFNGGVNMAIRENGGTVYSGGNWNINNVLARDRPQVGVYTWAQDGPQFTITLRNMCAGTTAQCNFVYAAAPGSTTPAITSSVPGTTPSTTPGQTTIPVGTTRTTTQAATTTSPACTTCTFIEGLDYYGGDIVKVTTTSRDLCCNACKAQAGCTRFTFRASSNDCFLKGDVVNNMNDNTVVSGTICTGTTAPPGQTTSTTRRATIPAPDQSTTPSTDPGSNTGATVMIRMSFPLDFGQVSANAAFQPTLAGEVCAIANLASYRCKVIKIASGSVLADVEIAAAQSSADGVSSESAALKIQAIVSKRETSPLTFGTTYFKTASNVQILDNNNPNNPPAESGGTSPSNNNMLLIYAAAAGAGLLLVIIAGFAIVRWKRGQTQKTIQRTTMEMTSV